MLPPIFTLITTCLVACRPRLSVTTRETSFNPLDWNFVDGVAVLAHGGDESSHVHAQLTIEVAPSEGVDTSLKYTVRFTAGKIVEQSTKGPAEEYEQRKFAVTPCLMVKLLEAGALHTPRASFTFNSIV